MHDYMRAIKLKICARENNRNGGGVNGKTQGKWGRKYSETEGWPLGGPLLGGV